MEIEKLSEAPEIVRLREAVGQVNVGLQTTITELEERHSAYIHNERLVRSQLDANHELATHNAGEISRMYDVLIELTKRVDRLERITVALVRDSVGPLEIARGCVLSTWDNEASQNWLASHYPHPLEDDA